MQTIYHGGALDLAVKKYGGQAAHWLDLSTGINPYHYPIENVKLDSWQQLPQAQALDELLCAASVAYRCPQKNILAANGTQILIEILPQILPKSRVAILSPTYEEHAANWQKYGHEILLTADVETAKQADHLIIVNPNNPTGRLFPPTELMSISAHFAAKNGYLIIDEAFMDMTPKMSMAAYIGQSGLIILRSFGKFFGLAGVRIGFMLAEQFILSKIRHHVGLWSVAGMSMDVACQALQDINWQENMRQTLAKDMALMQQILQKNEFSITGSSDLFCLVTMPKNQNADKYFANLAKQHILSRKFMNDEASLRFGLVKHQQQNEFAEKLAQTCAGLKP